MRPRLIPLLLVPVLALLGCGDGDDDTATVPGEDFSPREVLDIEVLALAEGEPPTTPTARELHAIDQDDPEAAAALFVEAEREAVVDAVERVELDGRILLGGVVHEGCFPAGEAVLAVVRGEVSLDGDHLDPQEGEVDCVQAVVTAAVVAVDPDDLPDGFDPVPAGDTVEVEGSGTIPSEVVVAEPTGYEGPDVAVPGLVRDEADLDALHGRYDLGEPDTDLRRDVETGEVALVAAVVGDECVAPVGARVARDGRHGIALVPTYGPDLDDDVACDALAQAIVVVAVDPAALEGVTTLAGRPVDAPTGVGAVQVLEPLAGGAEPLAQVLDGPLDPSALPGLPDLDLDAPSDGAVRLVFVVEACEPATAELVADTGSGTVRAVAQQAAGERVECEALSPYLVIADLAADHADLTPVVA